jgi:hypothetical protein
MLAHKGPKSVVSGQWSVVSVQRAELRRKEKTLQSVHQGL